MPRIVCLALVIALAPAGALAQRQGPSMWVEDPLPAWSCGSDPSCVFGAFALVGSAGFTALMAIFASVLTVVSHNATVAACATWPCTRETAESVHDIAQLADASWGATLALGVVGLVFALVAAPQEHGPIPRLHASLR